MKLIDFSRRQSMRIEAEILALEMGFDDDDGQKRRRERKLKRAQEKKREEEAPVCGRRRGFFLPEKSSSDPSSFLPSLAVTHSTQFGSVGGKRARNADIELHIPSCTVF